VPKKPPKTHIKRNQFQFLISTIMKYFITLKFFLNLSAYEFAHYEWYIRWADTEARSRAHWLHLHLRMHL